MSSAKRFTVVREDGPSKGLFDKELDPPPPETQNSTAPTYSPGDPIEAGVFNTSNWSEDIYLVRNKVTKVDYYMKPAPKNVNLVQTTADNTLFEGHTWGWDGTNRCAVVAQNYNIPSFKYGLIPQSLSYIDIFLHCLPLK